MTKLIEAPQVPESHKDELVALLMFFDNSYIEEMIQDEDVRNSFLDVLDNAKDATVLPKSVSGLLRDDRWDNLWGKTLLERINNFSRTEESRPLLDELLANRAATRRYRERS